MDMTTTASIDEIVLAAFPQIVDAPAVFVSGSAAEGWAHETSDLDVYAVVHDSESFDATAYKHDIFVSPSRVPIVIAFQSGRRIDLELWTPAQIQQVIERCASAGNHQQDLSAGEVDLLYRVLVGIPMWGASTLDELKLQVRAAGYQQSMVRRAMYSADTYLEDAAGALAHGDAATAVLAARFGWERAVDAVLLQHGEFAPSFKWRARKLQRAKPEVLGFASYWARQTMTGFSPESPERWIRETIADARRLILTISLDEFD